MLVFSGNVTSYVKSDSLTQTAFCSSCWYNESKNALYYFNKQCHRSYDTLIGDITYHNIGYFDWNFTNYALKIADTMSSSVPSYIDTYSDYISILTLRQGYNKVIGLHVFFRNDSDKVISGATYQIEDEIEVIYNFKFDTSRTFSTLKQSIYDYVTIRRDKQYCTEGDCFLIVIRENGKYFSKLYAGYEDPYDLLLTF